LSSILGFDIGGSSIKSAIVDTTSGRLTSELSSIVPPSPLTSNDLISAIKNHAASLEWRGPVGVGYPGVLIRGEARSAAHVDASFIGFNLQEALSRPFDQVSVINDADAAGLAEMAFGAGQEHNRVDGGTVLLITLGTGIGSALFSGGRLFPNTEFGHMMIGDREAEEIAAASVKTRDDLDFKEWTDQLNIVLREMHRLMTLDLIIIGGGVSENFGQFKDYIDVECPVKPAAMGPSAGVIGAALKTALDHKK